MKEKWFTLLVVLCLICIGVLLFLLVKDQKEDAAMDKQQQILEESFVEDAAEAETAGVENTGSTG